MDRPIALTIYLSVRLGREKKFTDWRARLQEEVTRYPGFLSLEIVFPSSTEKGRWVVIQRFSDSASLEGWYKSEVYQSLLHEVKLYTLEENSSQCNEKISHHEREGVTEIFVTKVSPDKSGAYRQWLGKIHQAESTFTGFQRVYVQPPREESGNNWITLLQFDTQENLDRWLTSDERQQILQETQSVVQLLESHRVISPFAGWFSNLSEAPSVWKQTMLVLLVLFPIVMVESRLLTPLIKDLPPAIGMFIGNAISVTLIAWPMMPIALYCLGWWLHANRQQTYGGIGLLMILYAVEIYLFS